MRNNSYRIWSLVWIPSNHKYIDNTITLEESDADNQLKRLSRNATLIKHTYQFLKEEGITVEQNEIIVHALEKLIYESETMSDSSSMSLR